MFAVLREAKLIGKEWEDRPRIEKPRENLVEASCASAAS